MRPISRSVTRKDHLEKVSGRALYMADLPADGVLTAQFVRAAEPNAAIASVAYPPMPDGYFVADGHDLPVNETAIHEKDMPVFATDHVRHVGEAIAIIAGPDPVTVARLVRETRVQYMDIQPAVTTIDEATTCFFDFPLRKGDTDSAFAAADFIHEETFETGRQEQAYLETNALQAWSENSVLTIEGSMQCPYYVVTALKHAFSRDESQVRVIQSATGGGFGGKEDYPSLLACQVGAVALKSGRKCRAVHDRHEDVLVTTKRHPSRIRYRAAVKDGRVTALDCDIILDGGAYTGLSSVVLQRSMFCVAGVYNVENICVRGRVMMTNTPSNGAFRGFGGPQTFFAIELLMGHIAQRLGEDALAFKARHFVRQGDRTSTKGTFHEKPMLHEMLRRALDMAEYDRRVTAYTNQQGRYRRGIGVSLVFHGCGFTGSGEREIIKAKIRLRKNADGSVDILGANTEMGQGVRTTFPKIVAQVLGMPVEQVGYDLPDTAIVPDSGPTVASRSVMIVGRLLERAAKRLKENWQDGIERIIDEDYVDPPHLSPYDPKTFTGDAYPAYAWSVDVIEVEVDTVTMVPRATGVWAVFDCGTPIDLNVLRGQAEGGILQGIGYAGAEWMDVRPDGAVWQGSLTDYIIPTAADAPPMQIEFYDDPYYEGPFGARGAGELTVVAAAPAFAAAVEHALGMQVHSIPLTPERILAQREEG